MTGLAIALAVLGAGCFAGAAVLQHGAVGAVTAKAPDGRLRLDGLLAVLGRPSWLAGLALAGAGAGLHVVALVLAPLSVVQPLGVLAVPLAVLLAAARSGRPPLPAVVAGAALCLAGVAGFVTLAAGSVGRATAVPGVLPAVPAAVLLTPVVVLAAVAALAATRPGRARCAACATAGAVVFGLASAALRALSQRVGSGAAAPTDLAVLAVVAGIVLALLTGGWLVQQALAAGPPEVVVACLTVVDPIVAVTAGVLLLGEVVATTAGTAVLLAGCAVAAGAGVVALARHHPDAAGRSADPPPDRDRLLPVR